MAKRKRKSIDSRRKQSRYLMTRKRQLIRETNVKCGDCNDSWNLSINEESCDISNLSVLHSFSSIINGSFSQGHVRFQFAGLQCCAISLQAFLYSFIKSPSLWQMQDIDSIVISRDRYFSEMMHDGQIPRKLMVKELPHLVE
jgi:hypothetical protein